MTVAYLGGMMGGNCPVAPNSETLKGAQWLEVKIFSN